MRIVIAIMSLLITQAAIPQEIGFSDFEDGTLQNWTDTDGNTSGMSVFLDPETSNHFLVKSCDGSNSAVGKMAIQNVVDFNGDYTCGDPFGINCIGAFETRFINENSFDLHLRLGFRGANNTKIVSAEADLFNWPVGSNRYFAEIDFGNNQFTVTEGTGTVEETLAEVVEIRVIHNEILSYDGAVVTGTLTLDYMAFAVLASTEDNFANSLKILPNPVTDLLIISSEIPLDGYRIYNVSGALISEGKIENQPQQIDVSSVSSGIYFAELISGDIRTTQKFIKQ